MGYTECLAAAGATVIDYAEFGSYQGNWIAFVEYKGEKGFVTGSYGSCSGCDSFMSEFDYSDDEPMSDEKGIYKNRSDYYDNITCTKEEYEEAGKKYNQRLADFGISYFSGGLYDKKFYENLLSTLKEDDWFDEEKIDECKWALNKNF